MALVFDGMPCALCGQPMSLEDDMVATSHFLDFPHPLAVYSDAAMHETCFEAWSERAEFIRAYFDSWLRTMRTNPYWGLVYESESIGIAVSAPPDHRVSVSSSSTLEGIGMDISHWAAAMGGYWDHPEITTPKRAVLSECRREVSAELPDAESLLQRLDLDALEARQTALREDRYRRRMKELDELGRHQASWRAASKSSPECPHCGNSLEIRRVDRFPRGRSFFVCGSCNRSFTPGDE